MFKWRGIVYLWVEKCSIAKKEKLICKYLWKEKTCAGVKWWFFGQKIRRKWIKGNHWSAPRDTPHTHEYVANWFFTEFRTQAIFGRRWVALKRAARLECSIFVCWFGANRNGTKCELPERQCETEPGKRQSRPQFYCMLSLPRPHIRSDTKITLQGRPEHFWSLAHLHTAAERAREPGRERTIHIYWT